MLCPYGWWVWQEPAKLASEAEILSEVSLMPLNHMVCISSAKGKCPYFSCWQGWTVCFRFGKGFAIFLKTLDQIMAVKLVGHSALVLCLVQVSSRGWWCLWSIQLSHTEEPGAMFKTCCWLLLLAQSDGFDLSLMCLAKKLSKKNDPNYLNLVPSGIYFST